MSIHCKFQDIAKGVRSHCIECMGGVQAEVPLCTSPDCKLYPFRMGSKQAGRKGNPNMAQDVKKHTDSQGVNG